MAEAGPGGDRPRLLADHVVVGEVLGSGGFSTVRVGTTREDGVAVAVKTLRKHGRGDVSLIRNEIQVMALLLEKVNSPYVVKLLDVFDDRDAVHLVVELCAGGELFDRIVSRGRYREQDAAELVRQMCSGLAALHEVGVLHRDLKPENVLFVNHGENSAVKIMDFGLSHVVGSEDAMVGLFGSLDYIAPEVLVRREYCGGSDVWSLGVITYILLCGQAPFAGNTAEEKQLSICACRYSLRDRILEPVSDSAKDLIRRILVLDPAARPTAAEILEHPWVRVGGSASPDLLPLEASERLAAFHAKRKFKAAVYAAIAAGNSAQMFRKSLSQLVGPSRLGRDELYALRDAFRATSSSTKSPLVSLEQFRDVVYDVGLDFPDGLLPQLFEVFDMNRDGRVDFRELVCGLSTLREDKDEAALRFCFDCYDLDGSGSLSMEELAKVLANADAGFVLLDDYDRLNRLHDVFHAMDQNKDGQISYEEFHNAIVNDPALADALLTPVRTARRSLTAAEMDESM